MGAYDLLEQRSVGLNALPKPEGDALRWLLDTDNMLGRLDYPFFVTKVLGHDFPEIWDPTVQARLKRTGEIFKNWVLTRHEQKVFRKVMFVNPRGTCKSAGTTIPLVPFAHLHDPEIAAMIMSAAYEQMALKFADTVRHVWDGDSPTSRLVDLYGRFKPANIRQRAWSRDKMVTERREMIAHADPTLAAFSIRKGPTSGHFKLGIIDDPVTEELMANDAEWLDKVWAAYSRMPFVLDNDALLVVIMTRYHKGDLVGRIITEEIAPIVRREHGGELPKDWDESRGWIKYAHLAGWEVFYDGVYDDYDYETKSGTPVYPVIWPHERIADVRKTPRGEALYQLQLQQDPAGRDDAPITWPIVDRLYIDSITDVPAPAMKTIDIHCDFSFKDAENYRKQQGDVGVAHLCAKEGGYVYRLGGFRGKYMQDQFGEKLMDLIAFVYYGLKSKVRYITYERTTGHGSGDESTRMWLHQLFMRHPDLPRATAYPIARYKQGNKSKLQRIMDTNWAWQEGYVVLCREAENNYQLCYQMVNQGYTLEDDDSDAFADAFHEKLYKRTRPGDLPEDVQQFMGGGMSERWTPLPPVHGHFDMGGRFVAERRTARNPDAQRPSLFGHLLRRN